MNEEIDLNKRKTPFTLKDRFFKWGIDCCDRCWPYYGGHTHWLAKLLDVDYLLISLCRFRKYEYQSDYYDGYHHGVFLYFIVIAWGGRPFNDGSIDEKEEKRKQRKLKLKRLKKINRRNFFNK